MSLHGYTDDEYDVGDDNNVTLISRLDVSSHLHLHPNDSVALTVVSVKLKGTENYQVWSCAMLLALEGKNKIGFIDGSCQRYNTDELNALWKQFDALVELPRCTCHAADGFKKYNQLMKLMQFLMGLDDTYMQIRSSILSRETLPDVRSAYAIISSEESHRVASGSLSGTSQRSQTSVFTVNAPNRGNLQRSQTSVSFSRPSNDNKPNDNRNRTTVGGSSLVCANQHMTYTDKNLVNVIDVSYLKVKVSHPNRTEAFITKIGNMPLTDYLTLYDVLVVPDVTFHIF
ncbi:ribonuclease H-like domain-containing protein, partial [Tanacetum coccineum]